MEESETTRRVRYYIGSIMCAKQLCLQEAQWIDSEGFHWCKKHHDRLLLMRYGKRNQWAAIFNEEQFLLNKGIDSYCQAAITWSDARLTPVVDEIRTFVTPTSANKTLRETVTTYHVSELITRVEQFEQKQQQKREILL